MYYSLLKVLIYKTFLRICFDLSRKLTSESQLTSLLFCKHIERVNKFSYLKPLKYNLQRKTEKYTRINTMYTLAENNHKSLIDNLKNRGIIDDDEVYDTMLQVDRGKYIKENPYVDTPVYISHGVTISSPHMHALSLKRLMNVLKPGSRAIDVGSGYLTVCMAIRTNVLENKNSFVIGLERVKDVVNFSIENIKRDKPELLHIDNFKIIHKNIYQVNEQEKEELGLFDAIHVGASASELPEILIDLLAENGKLIIPLEEGYTQVLYEITKKNGKIIKDRLFDVCFVTLKKN
ncbi:protein-L-isoaspartate(D-aspartate) O-methyltransferase, putative [Plasmodium malariae]|uniref:protein-L-isoaspartate(D-aspartate) O-methyltransferase n=1 Tax=Plasmodium malariae TaxID=5858 RepID=A0A1C3KES6_PLAMA|nr:protein-L-isoaspartate(D-aspartate) O-methyltransferase, putative [Plasmodium malariae]SBT72130.1 protein-L-isoaspartate(D-aspartate) O-methyltransferase, putative [Plasmodium malariae]SCP02629.1 protein-L-isoaspartate(D-aspartate) O-methyltransferase, putative [Plasmodium malariae]